MSFEEKGKGKAGTLRIMYKDFLKKMEVLEEKEKVSNERLYGLETSCDGDICLVYVAVTGAGR